MIPAPAGSDFDRADQRIPVDPGEHDIGLDPAALHPLAERIRGAFDSAPIADRIEQAWILPPDDDTDLLAY